MSEGSSSPGPRKGGRPPWAEFRAALEGVGYRPSKSLGQNFLLDTNLARAIVRDSEVDPGEWVLEVGTGCGFLSVHLAELGVRLLTIEIDERLFGVARRFLAPFSDVELLRADVLAGKNRLAPELLDRLPSTEPWSLVSNLPYGVAGPLLVLLSRLEHPPRSMTALVQLEVAERITAGPGQPAWGPLGVRLAARYEARLGRPVPRSLFWPRPRVESAVCHLTLREGSRPSLETFDALVGGLFQSRRKTVRRSLGALVGAERAEEVLAELGIEPGLRPEALELDAWHRLAHEIGPERP